MVRKVGGGTDSPGSLQLHAPAFLLSSPPLSPGFPACCPLAPARRLHTMAATLAPTMAMPTAGTTPTMTTVLRPATPLDPPWVPLGPVPLPTTTLGRQSTAATAAPLAQQVTLAQVQAQGGVTTRLGVLEGLSEMVGVRDPLSDLVGLGVAESLLVGDGDAVMLLDPVVVRDTCRQGRGSAEHMR